MPWNECSVAEFTLSDVPLCYQAGRNLSYAEKTLHKSLVFKLGSSLVSNAQDQVPDKWVKKQSWKWTFQSQVSHPSSLSHLQACVSFQLRHHHWGTDKSHSHYAPAGFLTYRICWHNKSLLVYANKSELGLVCSNATKYIEKLFLHFLQVPR